MEKKLKQLFDFQRFQNNERLARMIIQTENRYNKELDDEALSFVSAAGEQSCRQYGKDDGHDDK